MNEASKLVLDCFWLPENYTKTCISGVNQYSVVKYGSHNKQDVYSQKYFENVTLPLLRKNTIPFPPTKKRLSKSENYPAGFREIVNDALDEITKYRLGYVLTLDQLKVILKFVPDIKVALDDGVYYLRKVR